MNRMILFSILMTITIIPVHTNAQEISPGEYITERGWGNLKITKDNNSTLLFEIDAVGGNAHTCTLSGQIHSGKSVLEGSEKKKPCIVKFSATNDGIEVSDNDECSYYCGARAGFTGRYLKPQKGCDPSTVKKTRKEFKRLYDEGNYAFAREKLEPILTSC